jgi:mannosylglucosylglycerate synthase
VLAQLEPAMIAAAEAPTGNVRIGPAHKQTTTSLRTPIQARVLERQLAALRQAGFKVGKPQFEPVAGGSKISVALEHESGRFTMVMNPSMSPAPVVYTQDLRRLSIADLAHVASGESIPERPKMSLAFVVSRIGGEDGVSLEAMHWMRILSAAGHPIHVITGQRSKSNELEALERSGIRVHVIPEADPDPSKAENQREFEDLFSKSEISAAFTAKTDRIRDAIVGLIDREGIEALMLENFTLPWHHLAMGGAAASIANERRLPVVSRGHDFPHDRPAYHWNGADPEIRSLVERVYLKLPSVSHVAINTRDVERYFGAMGIGEVTVVPNTIDTNDPRIHTELEDPKALKRALLGEAHADDFVLVCPVRPVGRKRLDVAIDFVRRLQQQRPDLKVSMLVTHDTVDAPKEELGRLEAQAKDAGVNLVFGHPKLPPGRDTWDQYKIADVALYFSDFEGFGNALLEMIAFGLPVVINEYEIFQRDIAPVGFELMQVKIDGPDLGADLDRQAKATAAILDRKAASHAEEDRDRAERNLAKLEERYAYPVVARALTELLANAIKPRPSSREK